MSIRILQGHCIDVMRTLAAESVHTVVTSPPYWGLRDYGTEPVRWGDGWVGHLGLEPTPEAYVQHLLEVFREVRRVLHPEGTVWLNLGDCYATGAGSVGGAPGGGEQGARWRGDIYRDRDAKRRPRNDHAGRGHPAKADGSLADRKNVGPMTQPNRMPIPGLKPKDLVGIPWRVAFALQAEGWYLRNDIVWAKRNCMPESVRDRCTKSHEYIFLLTKNERYYYDSVAIEEEQEEEHERTRRLREQVTGLDTTYELRRDQAHGQVAPGKNGVVRSAKARHDLAVKGTRNKRTVWFVGTKPFSEAHFATFPPELIEPCILAGTSEYGHCSACGGGYDRILAEPEPAEGKGSGNKRRKQPVERGAPAGHGSHQCSSVPWSPHHQRTVGWRPRCQCTAPAVPGTVLDPFGGAGTTGLVADRYQRDAVLIELNPKYAAMGSKRITDDSPLFAEVSSGGQQPLTSTQARE